MATTKTQSTNSYADIFNVKATVEDRIIKMKIKATRERPFWGYLFEYVRFIKSDKVPTMGVDKFGRCFYNEKFVNGLSDDELLGVGAHEVQHVALRHVSRGEGREVLVNGESLWNVCIDYIDNNILLENQFRLPSTGLIPHNNSFDVWGITVDNIDKKAAEDIYEEIFAQLKRCGGKGKGDGKGKGNGDEDGEGNGEGEFNRPGNAGGKRFDDHLKPQQGNELAGEDGKEGEGEGEGQSQGEIEKDWNKIVAEAYHYAKQIGKSPAGMERMFDQLHKPRVNWSAVFRSTVTSTIPTDYSYSRPAKRYLIHDIFMPSLKREAITVLVSIDTSGSIGGQELNDFMSEVIGISRAFSNVTFRILTHDTIVHDDILIKDATIHKLKRIVPHGGGGTSHVQLMKYIVEKNYVRSAKLLVSFTDGYSQYPETRPQYPVLFVLAGGHLPKEQMPKWGKVVCLG